MDSHVEYACNVVVHNLAQKVEKPARVKRFLLMLHAHLLMLLTSNNATSNNAKEQALLVEHALLDDVIRSQQKGLRDRQPERLRGFEVDH
jgi:hypothetical protein